MMRLGSLLGSLSAFILLGVSAQQPASGGNTTITSMNVTFMGQNSGLPGGAWPPASVFNSTIDFTVVAADTTDSTNCSASWVYTKPSFDWKLCDDGHTHWRFDQDGWAHEVNFTIQTVHILA
jgi:hypothetical protein